MSTDFSWKRYAKNKSDSLEILQSEMDRAVADIEKQADVVDNDDIATLLGRLVESAVETKEEIETEVQKHNHETEEKLHALIKEDSQSKALFDLFGVQAETIETPSIEKPQIKELTNDMEDFLGGLAGVEEPEPEIVEEEPVIESEIAQTVAEVLAGDAESQIMQEPIELDLVGKTSELLSQIDDIEQAPELNEIEKLTERVELIQNQLSTYKVGWGQAGMTYGSGEVRLEFLDDIDRETAKTDGYYLQYQSSTEKWIGSVSTTGGWDPSGYEYTGDKTLETIENEVGAVYGLEIEEDTWTIMPCTGAVGPTPGSEDNNLPTSFSNRIWDRSSNRFSFAEIPTDGVVLFRLQTWLYPETNNALIKARINFVAIRDGTEHVLNEDGDRIVLEDDSGNITGDYFQAYNFYQTVSGQEMNDGAGVEHERTFIFPIYVGNAHAQRGFGQFELNCSCDFTLNDSSVVAVLN